MWAELVSYLEHLLFQVCERRAGHQVGVALSEWLPGDGGLSLDLLGQICLIIEPGADGQVQLQDGQSAALCIRKGQKHQGLTYLPIGRLWVATVPIISVVSVVVVVLCVLHVLVLTTLPIRATVAHYLDCVVLRHIQPVTRPSGAVGQRQDKQVWFWAGETGLGKQAG